MKTDSTKKIGTLGESYACAYLAEQGYTILCRNYTTRHGELDIIAQKEDIIAFVEVKTRTKTAYGNRYGRPAKAVDRQKWEHIFFAARTYLSQYPQQTVAKKPRLDVIEVYLKQDGQTLLALRHYPSAYSV